MHINTSLVALQASGPQATGRGQVVLARVSGVTSSPEKVGGRGDARTLATKVSLSAKAKEALRGKKADDDGDGRVESDERGDVESTEKPEAGKRAKGAEKSKNEGAPGKLSEAKTRQVREMQKRDSEVRAHEAAHVAAAAGNTNGGIQYERVRGPDNKQYAVGGHVSIDTAPVAGDPAATIQKAETVRRAALAPSDPSGADRQVAAKASSTSAHARTQLAAEKQGAQDKAKEGAPVARGQEAPSLADVGSRATVRASQAIASYAAVAA